jgi:hypothetical protein
MSPLFAFLIATPIFGFQLSAPAVDFDVSGSLAPPQAASLGAPVLALDIAMAAEAEAPRPDDGAVPQGTATPNVIEPGASTTSVPTAGETASASAAADEEEYANAIRGRNRLAKIHRILGITTWVAMAATLTFGFIQYSNLYGFGGSHTDNPCVNGNAIGGYEACLGRPLPHTISSIVTTALYASTFSLSLFMPDPDNASEGDSDFARTLRTHKILRWIHLFGMISQITLGLVTANLFDRASESDFKTAQALGTVHMGIGLVTFGALTWAGAMMVF